MYRQRIENPLYSTANASAFADIVKARKALAGTMPKPDNLKPHYIKHEHDKFDAVCCCRCRFYSPNLDYQIFIPKNPEMSVSDKNTLVICQSCYFAENIEWALRGKLIDVVYFPELSQVAINKLVRGLYCSQHMQTRNIFYDEMPIGAPQWNEIVLERGDNLFRKTEGIGIALNETNSWLSLLQDTDSRRTSHLFSMLKDFRYVTRELAFSADELEHFCYGLSDEARNPLQ